MLIPVTFKAPNPGPNFLILGAIHGNEKCGTIAIDRVTEELTLGKTTLTQGSVTFVPICNPRAYERDVRFTERNLNRYLVPTYPPTSYEAELGNELCPLLEKCDVLLDIHSYTVGGKPFAFVGETDMAGHDFARALGDVSLVTGWPNAYAASGHIKTAADANESVGTTEYARQHNAVAVTLECGQHKDPTSPEVAYTAIHNALRFLGMTHEPKTVNAAASTTPLITVTKVIYQNDEGVLAKNWKHLDAFRAGDLLATRADGTVINAPEDGYMVMPRAGTPPGEEWFYIARS